MSLVQEVDLGNLDRWAETPKLAGNVRPLAAFEDDIWALMTDPPGNRGDVLPWQKTRTAFRCRAHEVTYWFGRRGSWKSTIVSQMLLHHAVASDRRVMLASLEMPAAAVGAMFVTQACMTASPTRKQVADCLARLNDRILIVNARGRITPREAIALMRWAAFERQCHHFALDNLTKVLGVDKESAAEQQDFGNDVASVAMDTGMHIHLLAHERKAFGAAVDKPGTADDMRGSGSMADQADNVVNVWRNRPKEAARADGDASKDSEADVVLTVLKQRYHDFEGSISLWAHRSSRQFVQDGISNPINYATPKLNAAGV